MANDNRSSGRNGDNGRNAGKRTASSSTTTSDSPGLRRSSREKPSSIKSITTPNPSPARSRKSERLEKQQQQETLTPEKQNTEMTPLRRSERGKKMMSSSPGSSGTKNSGSGSLGSHSELKKKQKKEKSVKQLTMETKEVDEAEEVQEVVTKGEKKLDARTYRALFKKKGHGEELNRRDRLSQGGSSNQGCAPNDVESKEKCVGLEKNVEKSNSILSGPPKLNLESNVGPKCLQLDDNKFIERVLQTEDADELQGFKIIKSVAVPSYEKVAEHTNDVLERDQENAQSKLVDSTTAKHINDVLERDQENAQSKLVDSTAPKHTNDVFERDQENAQSKLVDSTTIIRVPDGSLVVEGGQTMMSSKRKRDIIDWDSNDDTAMVSKNDTSNSVVDVAASSPHGDKRNDFKEMCSACSKKQRVNTDSKQEVCSCNGKTNYHAHGTSITKGRGETEAMVTTGLAELQVSNFRCSTSSEDFQVNAKQNRCAVCKLGGKLLCCVGRGCRRSYHLSCLDPPLKDVPFGVWLCITCVRKKIKSNVYTVSEGVESVWDVREVEVSDDNGLQRQKQFFVKYKGLAHVHNRWVRESQLLEAAHLVAKFNKKKQGTRWKQEWTVPRRFLQKRLLISPKQHDEFKHSDAGDTKDCSYEWLVKWCGLHYEHATWELENDPFMNTLQAQSLMRNYESRHEKKLELQKGPLAKLSKLSGGGLSGCDFNNLDFVNHLRERWKKKQNTVILDDQEGIMKVISFILSLLSDVSKPFLIITTVSELLSWDEEFFRLDPSVDIVVYKGSNDLRKYIRALEFYTEAGCIMFQILITSPEAILEDQKLFESINWEAIIVDECQLSRIHSYFEKVKMLKTDLRLLLVNGQLKDGITEHLLSLLDCPSVFSIFEGLKNSSHKNDNLKARLSRFIANDFKSDSYNANDLQSDSSRFLEHWVPVQISNMQLEQYCATLLSNSSLLCPPSKNLVEALRDILISTRKCCDHPYIMDPMLQISLTKDGKEAEILDVGIKASGKLQLLDQMLFEIRKKGSKVLILFQSGGGSGRYNIGDILDDYMCLRFGQDSYERIDGFVIPSKKVAALHNFNNLNGRFVLLLETRSRVPSIKLSSVNTVIIYGSDWNPINDLRYLQKITFDSQVEHTKVFRLYSSFTVEERVLILARQGKPLDSNLQNMVRGHNILMSGASHLFSKLAEFHSANLPTSSESSLLDRSLESVIEEFSTLLSQTGEDSNVKKSVIIKLKQGIGSYDSSFPLTDELNTQLMNEELPHVFWKKLFEGKQPRWKYSSITPQRSRKRVQYFDNLSPYFEGAEVAKKRKKVANHNTDPHSLKPDLAGHMVSTDKEGSIGAPAHNTSQSPSSLSGSTKYRTHASYTSFSPFMPMNISEFPESNVVDFNEGNNFRYSQKNLHLLLKPEIAKLCEVLQLPEDLRNVADGFLEYVMNNHHVSREPTSILQAFQISLCWTAATMLKHKLKHKESLALARRRLNFSCKKEEAEYVYSMLRCLKKIFLYHMGKTASSPKASPLASQVLSKVHSQLSNLQKEGASVDELIPGQEFSEDHDLSPLGLAQKDVLKSISDVEKNCDLQMKKLLLKQQEELKKFERKYEEEKAQLETKQRTEAAVIRLHSNSATRADKLKLLDTEYGKKFEELKCQMELQHKIREDTHMAARNKLQHRKAHWIDGLKSWAQVELLNKLGSSETGNDNENLNFSDSCLKDQIPDREHSPSDGEVLHESLGSNDDKEYPPETAPPGDAYGRTTGEKDVHAATLHGQDNVVDVQDCQTDGEIPLESPETTHHEVVDGGKTDKQDGNVLGNEILCTEDCHLPERNCMFNQQTEDLFSRVPASALDLIADDSSCGRDSNGAVMGPVGLDGLVASRPETASSERADDASGSEKNGACIGAEHDGLLTSGSEAPSLDKIDSSNSSREVVNDAGVGLQDGLFILNDEIQDLSQAFEDGSAQPTVATNLPEVGATGIENQSVLLQVEVAECHPRDDVASVSLNGDAPVPVVHSQLLPSVDSPSTLDVTDSLSSIHESHLTDDVAQNCVELSDPAALQPGRQSAQVPVDIPSNGSRMPIPEIGIMPTTLGIGNHPLQAASSVRIPLLSCQDPLQNELERIRKETDQIINALEETKLQLKSDCEKEIEEVVSQIRMKYETKLREAESGFTLQKKELDANHNKVLMNKILAEAFRTKCMDIRTPSGTGSQQELSSSLVQQLLLLSLQPTAQRPPIASGPSSTSHLASTPQITPVSAPAGVSSRSAAPPTVSAALFSGVQTRPPLISSISPSAVNLQVGSGIRTPAPHLQPFRSSASMSSGGISSSSCLMPGQQVPGNPPTTLMLSHLQKRLLPSTTQSVPHNGALHRPQAIGIQPLPSSSMRELLRNVDNQTSTNPIPPSILIHPMDFGSSVAPPNGTRTNQSSPSEIVCLSDDE